MASLPKFNKTFSQIIKTVELMASEKGTSIEELEKALNLKRRSIFRVINTIEDELKFPVSINREGFGGIARYHLPETYISKLSRYSAPDFALTLNEVLLLHFLLSHDSIFENSEIAEDISFLKQKIKNLLPLRESEDAPDNESWDIFAFSPNAKKSYIGKEHIFDTITEAIKNHNPCNVTYHAFSSNTIKKYIIHPLKIVEHRGGIYILTRIPKHDSINALAMERIQDIELLQRTFIPPKNFDANAIMNTAFDMTFDDPVSAVVNFSAGVTPYIQERRWSNRQKIETHKDGSCTMTITTSGRNDLIYWLLSWGENAEIISPESLRKTIKGHIKGMNSLYSKN
jgi:predicted DNA-binding transcriptional regulator YafY